MDEQLAHVLESTLIVEPDRKEASPIFSFECLNTYTFMLTTIPKRIEVIVARMKPITASSGR